MPHPGTMAGFAAASSDAQELGDTPCITSDETPVIAGRYIPADGDEPLVETRLLQSIGFRPSSGEPVPRARRVHEGGVVYKELSCFLAETCLGACGQAWRPISSRHVVSAFDHCPLFTLQMSLRL